MQKSSKRSNSMSRRQFFQVGSAAAVAGSTLSMCSGLGEKTGKIRKHRVLGRTGFKVSDIALGGAANESDVIRYAYDKGVNYFDTAESYGGGASEKAIGGAMQFMDRKKIFITTKIHFNLEETEESLLERFGKCQERLQTDYVDALFIHSVSDLNILNHTGFHAATEKLKADGRVRFVGLSSHGPGDEGDSMEKVLCAASEDGRFDLMLLVYNFMNREEGEKVLAACKKNNVGTTAMKTMPGRLIVYPFDPENPTGGYKEWMDSMIERGRSKDEAVKRIQDWVKEQEKLSEDVKPFAEKHGIQTNEKLRMASLQWVLANPDMHTVCMGLENYEELDAFIPLSGTKLSHADAAFLSDYQYAFNNRYCRHGCTTCVDQCAHKLPVSTIMRYSYYFAMFGREQLAMRKYAKLESNGSLCLNCTAPCTGACPHGVDIRNNMISADSILSV